MSGAAALAGLLAAVLAASSCGSAAAAQTSSAPDGPPAAEAQGAADAPGAGGSQEHGQDAEAPRDAGALPASAGVQGAAAGPEPLWVPDPESLTEIRERARRAADAFDTATIAPDPALHDDATRVATAHWMAAGARDAGLPGELPVMAALVESGLRNLPYGDADSVGFFQMRLGVWDHGPYAGYLARPELQLRWFVDHAVALRDARRAAGDATFGEDAATWGEWIADVERPHEAYRGRYQTQLETARALLALPAGTVSPLEVGLTVGGPAAPPPDPDGDPLARRVLADDRIELDPRARSDLATPGRVDPRVSALLLQVARRFDVAIWVLQTGHSYLTAGGSVSNHSVGRAVDIGSVGGEVVSPSNEDAKELALALGRLPARLRPTEIGTPWAIDEPGYFTDAAHRDHLHVGFDDPVEGAAALRLAAGGSAGGRPRAAAPRAEPGFRAGGPPASGAGEAGSEPRFDPGG